MFLTACKIESVLLIEWLYVVVMLIQKIEISLTTFSMYLQLFYGWQSEQSGGLPKNTTVGHTDRADH